MLAATNIARQHSSIAQTVSVRTGVTKLFGPCRSALGSAGVLDFVTSCVRGDTACPLSSPVGAQAPRAPSSRRNVAVLSHAEYVPTLTATAALRVKAELSKAAW